MNLAVFIHNPLDIREQFRGILDFIQDHAIGVIGKEPTRVGQRNLPDIRLLKGDIGQVRKSGSDKGSLARLTRTGERDHLELLRQRSYFGC